MVSDQPPVPHRPNVPSCLSIAGSDPSGGAGIQADLKVFSAMGVYGGAAITALTAQNTRAVTAVHAVPPEFMQAQLDALAMDLRFHAIKVGMVANAGLAAVVADWLSDLALEDPPPAIVVDPVMVSKGGDPLLEDDAVAAIRDHLLPLASVITPNRHEAARLLGECSPPESIEEMEDAARSLASLTSAAILVKGGGLGGPDATDESIVDVLVDHGEVRRLESPRIDTPHLHGTGCTLSSAVAAGLAWDRPFDQAIEDARRFVVRSLESGWNLCIGLGKGPPDHLHAIREAIEGGDR
ncbi:MAG: bifunctional hydroxymethylpyrimidine kinase/phosphomethylpyrimidine kinase [Phycisphaerales bacterium]